MKIIEIEEIQAMLTEYASNLTQEPIIITSNGQPIAALVTLESIDIETISLSTNPKFIELIERLRSKRGIESGVSSTEMRRRLGLSTSNHADLQT